jgi:hypothetical protein
MRDVHKIIDVSVTTSSTRPLRAIVEIEAVDSTRKFRLTEAIALRMCTDLERFLTQEPQQGGRGAGQPLAQCPHRTEPDDFHVSSCRRRYASRLSAVYGMLQQTRGIVGTAQRRNKEIDSIVVSADRRVVEAISALKAISARMTGCRSAFF